LFEVTEAEVMSGNDKSNETDRPSKSAWSKNSPRPFCSPDRRWLKVPVTRALGEIQAHLIARDVEAQRQSLDMSGRANSPQARPVRGSIHTGRTVVVPSYCGQVVVSQSKDGHCALWWVFSDPVSEIKIVWSVVQSRSLRLWRDWESQDVLSRGE